MLRLAAVRVVGAAKSAEVNDVATIKKVATLCPLYLTRTASEKGWVSFSQSKVLSGQK